MSINSYKQQSMARLNQSMVTLKNMTRKYSGKALSNDEVTKAFGELNIFSEQFERDSEIAKSDFSDNAELTNIKQMISDAEALKDEFHSKLEKSRSADYYI